MAELLQSVRKLESERSLNYAAITIKRILRFSTNADASENEGLGEREDSHN